MTPFPSPSCNIAQALAQVQQRIAQAVAQAGRPANSVRLLAVSKTFPADAVAKRCPGGADFLWRKLCTGRLFVMGMGKSGHVGHKIAATLASTGTPAFFVHPAEASHGDLGMVRGSDVVLALSNSGESHEITDLLPVLKRQGVRVAAMTGNLQSTLAQHADWVLDTSVEREACPLNLAPTASTTVQLALGDALATALLDARGFQAEDFARSHPGGSLGARICAHRPQPP
jgi:D-arabinose 5-phosphate isomerase GutQ